MGLWILEEAPAEYELLYEEAVPHLIQMQNEINCKQSSQSTQVSSSDTSSAETEKFSFPDLIRRSSTQDLTNCDVDKLDAGNDKLTATKPFNKMSKVSSRYASGLFMAHPDFVGNDYIKSTNAKQTKRKAKTPRKSPLMQRISSLPSPSNLTHDETLNGDMEDQLKVFGFVFCADNDRGMFSQIIENSDIFLSLSMNLINSIKAMQQIQMEKERRNKGGKGKKRGKNRNANAIMDVSEERDEFDKMREFEDSGMLNLVLEQNAMHEYIHDQSIKIKNGCVISPNCTIGVKTKIDKCILGPFVSIGKNCKIDNCVILKHVSIGDHCKISNSIISTYASIGDKCSIHNCKVAERANITKECNFKNETIQNRGINEYDLADEGKDNDGDNEEDDDDDSVINVD